MRTQVESGVKQQQSSKEALGVVAEPWAFMGGSRVKEALGVVAEPWAFMGGSRVTSSCAQSVARSHRAARHHHECC